MGSCWGRANRRRLNDLMAHGVRDKTRGAEALLEILHVLDRQGDFVVTTGSPIVAFSLKGG